MDGNEHPLFNEQMHYGLKYTKRQAEYDTMPSGNPRIRISLR